MTLVFDQFQPRHDVMIVMQADALHPDSFFFHQSLVSKSALSSWVDPQAFVVSSVQSDFRIMLAENQINLNEEASFHRLVYKIFDDNDAREESTIKVPFNPAYQTVKFHFIRVYRDGKVLDKLEKAKIHLIHREQNAEINLYDGMLSALIFLDDIRENDLIDYAYSINGFDPILKPHFCHAVYFQFNESIEKYYLRLIAPRQSHLFIKNHGGIILKPKIQDLNENQQEWIWETRHCEAKQTEANQPSWYQDFPHVQMSTFATWQEVAQWGVDLYQLPVDLLSECSAEMLEVVAQWKREYATPEEQALCAIRFVQDKIRYLGLETGIHSFKPKHPTEVFQSRFGDCKDKTQLLRALLTLLGIKSYPTLVNSLLMQSLLHYHPSPWVFNHVILQVLINGNVYWVDSTLSQQGGDISNNYYPDLRYGLALKLDTRELSPLPTCMLAETEATITLFITDEEGAALEVVTVYKNANADWFRGTYKQTAKQKIAKESENYYSRFFGPLKTTRAMQMEDQRMANQITVREFYYIEKLVKIEDNKIRSFLISPPHLQDHLNIPEEFNRTTPLRLHFPFHFKEIYHIIQTGEEWPTQQEIHQFSDHGFSYHVAVNTDKNVMTLAFEYQNIDDHIEPEEVTKHYELLSKASDQSTLRIQIGKSSIKPLTWVDHLNDWFHHHIVEQGGGWAFLLLLYLLIRALFRLSI